MNTINFSPNYSNTNSQRNNTIPAFKGALGDKFVAKLAKGEVVKTEDILNAVKGTFGPKSEKVADVLESLLGRVQVLTAHNEANLKGRQIAESELAKVPQKIEDAKCEIASSMRESFDNIIKAKNAELAAKDAELKTAKEYAAKYEPMVKVKSIEELGAIMPEQAIKTLNQMVAHKTETADSILNFLMTGKGQEAVLAQIERQNIIMKAHKDGITNIPEVQKTIETLKKDENLYTITDPLFFTTNLIESALLGNPKASLLESKMIRNQVKENAMGLLTPMFNSKYYNMTEKGITELLEKSFDDAINFHKNFAKGKEKITQQFKDAEIVETIVPYDNSKSKITIKEKDGNSLDINFWQIANRGEANF